MAHPPPGQSLRTRLATLTTVVAVVVVGGGALLQTTLSEWRAEEAIRDQGRLMSRDLAEKLGAASVPPSATELHSLLEIVEASPAVQVIGVLLVTPDGLEMSESSAVRLTDAEMAVARRAIRERQDVWSSPGGEFAMVGVPIVSEGRVAGAVVTTITMELERELAIRGRMLVLWFATGTAVVLVVLVTYVDRKLIHQPLSSILTALTRYGAGDFSARTPVVAPDEIGQVASALNDLLARIEQLRASLQDRVDEATTELRRSHDDLVKSYQRMFALREALARAEQTAAAGQTAANLAHQLGTPLNLISGYVQMMLEDAQGHPRQTERLRNTEEQIKRVTGFIRTTLDAVRRPALPKEPIFPAILLRHLTEVSRPRLMVARITVDVRIDDDLPWLLGDAVQLELALLNLVNNALDAMPGGGTLTIVGEARGSDTHIEVRDTGSGIPADLLPRIFDPWITTKPVGQGTGLGLSIARDVITAHGGRISVGSSSDTGTTFAIDLPGKLGSPATREG